MSLDSTSTMAQIEAAYDDNASYAEDANVTKCRLFITACRMLLRRMPAEIEQAAQASARLKLSPELIQAEKKSAEDWLARTSTAAQDNPISTYGDFRNSRGGNCP